MNRAYNLSAAFIHTVHGGAEPRACLTGLTGFEYGAPSRTSALAKPYPNPVSHTKPREPHVRQQGGGARVVCDPGH